MNDRREPERRVNATVNVGAALAIIDGHALRELLLAAVNTPVAELILDLRDVDVVDSVGVQMLLATRKSMAERGSRATLINVPSVVADVLATAGLDSLLRQERSDTVTGAGVLQ